MTERFKVINGSQAGYTAFEATIVDTTRDAFGQPASPDTWRFFSVAECHDRNDALTTCIALNETNKEPA